MRRIKFILDGCDISFTAEAPEDITLSQLLKQCDRIKPDWCACGLRSFDKNKDYSNVELMFEYDNVKKTSDNVSCKIN